MQTLWIFGDSFSQSYGLGESTWTVQLARALGMTLANHSLSGAGQDWIWFQLHQNLDQIQPNDRVYIVLTEPSRYWYWQDYPEITNLNYRGQTILTRQQQQAMESYAVTIQRPQLDWLALEHRLGWLDSQCSRLGIKATILPAFHQYVHDRSRYPNLAWIEGALIDISVGELDLEQPSAEAIYQHWVDTGWRGIDPRFNHMSMTNHHWLAHGLAQGLSRIQGFHQKIVTKKLLQDPLWCQHQLMLAINKQ